MIGTALIEECLRHDVEVYAVVRADSSKKDRLPRDKRVHLIDGSLEDLSMLPGRISEKCDTFYHIAWGKYRREPKPEFGTSEQKYHLHSGSCKSSGETWLQTLYRCGSQAE